MIAGDYKERGDIVSAISEWLQSFTSLLFFLSVRAPQPPVEGQLLESFGGRVSYSEHRLTMQLIMSRGIHAAQAAERGDG